MLLNGVSGSGGTYTKSLEAVRSASFPRDELYILQTRARSGDSMIPKDCAPRLTSHRMLLARTHSANSTSIFEIVNQLIAVDLIAS